MKIYIEGGGDSKDLHTECRRGFRKLLESCGFKGKMPRLVACGSRDSAFRSFKTALKANSHERYAMLIDSEDPVEDIYKTWEFLCSRDEWEKPELATDEQVFLMVTCMETWIIADRETLKSHYGDNLNEATLPSLNNIEKKDRHFIQQALEMATKYCSNSYKKGKRSFVILGKLSPEALRKNLTSFNRMEEILKERLNV